MPFIRPSKWLQDNFPKEHKLKGDERHLPLMDQFVKKIFDKKIQTHTFLCFSEDGAILMTVYEALCKHGFNPKMIDRQNAVLSVSLLYFKIKILNLIHFLPFKSFADLAPQSFFPS